MKSFIFVFVALWMVAAMASAQDDAAATSDTAAGHTAAAPAEDAAAEEAPAEEEKKSLYQKKVKGLLWAEFGIGPSGYEPTKFLTVDVTGGGGNLNLPKGKGPQYAIAGGVQLGGFKVGIRWKWGNYDTYQLMGLGVDLGGDMRFVPYVHPILGVTLNYNSLRGVAAVKGDGGGITATVGIRVPIIRWISFFTTFNWTLVALWTRGTPINDGAILGQQLDGQFGLTFHFIGN